MPFPKFAISAPGTIGSQRITRLENENRILRAELELVRRQLREAEERAEKSEAWFDLLDVVSKKQSCLIRLE